MTPPAMLTWNGHVGAACRGDDHLHLTNERGDALCDIAARELVPVRRDDFTRLGDFHPQGFVAGGWCDTCRERGFTPRVGPDPVAA